MHKLISGVAAGLCLASGAALAIDTDKTILCATTQVQDCPEAGDCVQVLPEDVGAPTFMRINMKKKEIAIGNRSVTIERSEEVENRLVLQGAEDGSENRPDGIGWTLSVGQDNGRFVLAGASEQAAIILFGACTEI